MRSKLAALAALSLISASAGASAQALSPPAIGLSERGGEPVEGANAAEGAWILIPIVLGTLAVLIIAVSVSDNGASDSP